MEYDSTGGVRQLIKCPTCFCCAHGVSRENSLNKMNNIFFLFLNNSNDNNHILGLNIFCVIQITVSTWSLGAELES